MHKENRQYPRSKVNWSATMMASQRLIKGEVKNVSPSGAFISCEKPLAQNQVFHLSIHIHAGVFSLASMAESVWLTSNGMGVRFHSESPQEHQLLSECISEACGLKTH